MDAMLAFLDAGGPVVIILLFLSVAATAIVLVKLWQFHAMRIGDRKGVAAALRHYRMGHETQALILVGNARNPILALMGLAIRGGHRGLGESVVREEVMRRGAEILEELRSWMRPLEVIASLAPLLGLFGTVLGMIEAFRNLADAGSRVDPSILSGGIWEALLTTAVGLGVAIPVVALLNWLERRIDRLAHDMENAVTLIFTVDLTESPEAGGIPSAAHLAHSAAAAGD
jgi:biopolymer transport protein ExbB